MKNKLTITLLALAVFTAALGAAPDLAQAQGKKPAQKPAEDAAPATPVYEKNFPVKASWTLISFNDKPISANDEISFSIDENFRGTGFGGCNSWSAAMYPQKGQKILMGPIAITKKDCGKEKVLMEFNFLSALRSGPSWDVTGSQMTMKGPRGGAMKFQRSF